WSAIGKFIVKGQSPGLVGPAAGSYVSGRDAYFTWRPVPSAASYQIERRTPGDGRILEVVRTVGLSWAPTRVIENGRYEWRVTAYDLKGGVLGRSGWRAFSVDGTAPRVVKKTPTKTATRTANFVATFNEPVRGVNTTTMALFVKGQQHRLSSTVRMSNGGKTATLNPAVNMKVGRFYTLRLTKGIKDRGGNPLKPLSWSVTVK
ncbi:MAG: Ig-like domain-containing protein, partial [Nocardioidaceae bacterium]